MPIQDRWEQNHGAFEVLQRKEFDALCNEGRFADGPLIGNPGKWISEFGPYDPQHWAFGKLKDSRLVCCDTAAEAEGGET